MRPLFDKERREERRRARRREKTTVRDADVNDLLGRLGDLSRPGGLSLPMGTFTNPNREIVLYPGADPTVREHELVHAEQYSPLKSLVNRYINPLQIPGRAQDPQTRRSVRKIKRSIGRKELKELGGSTRELLRRLGSSDPSLSSNVRLSEERSPLTYMLNPLEFEAVSTSAVNSPAAKNVDFTQGFDQVKDALYALGEGPEPNINIYHLRSAMDQLDEIGAGDREKDLFMKAVRSNLRS